MAESYHRFPKNGSDIFEGRLEDRGQLDAAREFGVLARRIFSRRGDASTEEIGSACPSGESSVSMQVLGCFRFRGKKHMGRFVARSTWSRVSQNGNFLRAANVLS
jgi:hypothetical protein